MNNEILTQNRISFFDELAEKWDQDQPPSSEQVKSFIARLNIQPCHTVLDIGTGTGILIPYIFEYNPEKVFAIDLSTRMLEKLTEKFQNHFGTKLMTLCDDVHNWDLEDRSADIAICNGVYPHFRDQPLALAQIFKVLKPGGILAINHFNSKEYINSVHARLDHDLIHQDILQPVTTVANVVKAVGFTICKAIDNQIEYCLIAQKP